MDERLSGWRTLRRRLNRREWGETRQDAHLAQTPASRQTFGLEDIQPPCVAPEPTAAPTIAQPAPAAPAAQAGAKGRKPTFVQGEFRW